MSISKTIQERLSRFRPKPKKGDIVVMATTARDIHQLIKAHDVAYDELHGEVTVYAVEPAAVLLIPAERAKPCRIVGGRFSFADFKPTAGKPRPRRKGSGK